MHHILPFLAVLLITTNSHSADWPMFHGADGENRSPDTGLLKAWPEDGPPLLWRIDTLGEGQSGFSSVTISGGRIYTAGIRDSRSLVFCLDMTGKTLWEYDNGAAWEKSYAGTRSTPTVDGDRVYDFSAVGELACLDAKTGRQIWRRNVLTDFEGETPIWALAESVRIDGDRVICSPGGKKAAIVALDKMTGKLVWATPTLGEKTSYACPTIFTQDGLRILATMYAKGLVCANADTGELLFTHEHLQRYDINCCRPIYHDGHLFITAPSTPPMRYGGVQLKITVTGKKASAEQVWQNPDFDNLHDSVILLDGYLYGSSHEYRNGMFMCVDWKTGETVYEKRDVGKACFTYADGMLYYMGERGGFRLIRPNPEAYDAVSAWTVPDEGEGPAWAHPVVHEKKLYIRRGKFLYCYDVAQK